MKRSGPNERTVRRIWKMAVAAAIGAGAYYALAAGLILFGGLGMDPKVAWFIDHIWRQPGLAIADSCGWARSVGFAINMVSVGLLCAGLRGFFLCRTDRG